MLEKYSRIISTRFLLCHQKQKKNGSTDAIYNSQKKQEKDRINETSIRPFRKSTYTHFPEYIDPRLRNLPLTLWRYQ
ncbi:phage anti-RecBCD protein [Escherichia coli]|uniref:phage anti-RecBCD protein n=1 Tax=Escherichia coli TaxID=562 RepID=UPI000A962151